MNISLNHKTDQSIAFQYYDTDGTTPRTLSGATVYFTVKAGSYSASATDTDALIKKDITSHTNAAQGQTSIDLTNADTNIRPSSSYHYDVKVKETSGKVYLAQSGICSVTASPTNRA